ncbi:MAG: YibE/F family protein [Acidimicrobiia bacterium]
MDDGVSRRVRRRITAIAVALGIATAVALVVLWPRHDVSSDLAELGFASDLHEAVVLGTTRGPCNGTEGGTVRVVCDQVRFRLNGGPDRGQTRTIEFADAPNKPTFATGDEVILSHNDTAPAGFDYTYSDRQRRGVMWVLVAVFAIAVIALGRWRGLGALVGLGASVFVILQFVVPAMLEGTSPPVVAVVGASAIAFLALYLANGVNTLTTVALLSTLAALAITVVLATVFTELAQFTGAASEDALLLKLGAADIDLRGLVLAGMVLGALGALDDVTVTQAATVGELRAADPESSRRAVYRAGMRVGRDHVASAVNTLALAYAGAALPILILFSISGRSLGAVANGEVVAVEIVSALVGSIGLVAAVPISTGLAVVVTGGVGERRTRRRRVPADTPADDLLAPRTDDTFWS